jgi:hypothetical protein
MTTENKIHEVIKEGSLTIFGVELKFVRLDNGTNVIEAESLEKFFEALADPNNLQKNADEAMMELAKRIKEL